MQAIVMGIIGLLITLIGTVSIGPSIFSSSDAATASKVAEEVAAIRSAAIMWGGTKSPDGTFLSISTSAVAPSIPDLVVGGDGWLHSTAKPEVTYSVVPNPATGGRQFGILILFNAAPKDFARKTKDKLSKIPATQVDDLIEAINGIALYING